MTDEIKLVKVEYWRQVKAPSLKQFLYRRAVKEAMAKIKEQKGVSLNPETGFLVPNSALAAKEALKGLTAEKILASNPFLKEEYERLYGRQSDK